MISEKHLHDLQQAIKEIFNLPLAQQPEIIVNLGCGKGGLLFEIYQMICNHTLRGENLEDHSLQIFGIDASQDLLETASKKLASENVKAHVHGYEEP